MLLARCNFGHDTFINDQPMQNQRNVVLGVVYSNDTFFGGPLFSDHRIMAECL
jgi:hypothetical protein